MKLVYSFIKHGQIIQNDQIAIKIFKKCYHSIYGLNYLFYTYRWLLQLFLSCSYNILHEF